MPGSETLTFSKCLQFTKVFLVNLANLHLTRGTTYQLQWSNDISLGEYMICEGLAENFATYLYGEENVGPWVSKTDEETLNEYIKPLIQDALDVQGFDNITSYMYGDELAQMQNYIPVGMPYCAGYACGYYMVKYYLEKTGKSIVEATILPAEEILKEIDGFWEERITCI